MIENQDIESLYGLVRKYPLYIYVKASVYNDCNLPLLASIDYVVGLATTIIHVDKSNIEKYHIIFVLVSY